MKSLMTFLAFGVIGTFSFSAHADLAKCTVIVPKDCEIANTNIIATNKDTVFVVTVDCKKDDGSYYKLVKDYSYQSIWRILAGGAGFEKLPNVINFKHSDGTQQVMQLSCENEQKK